MRNSVELKTSKQELGSHSSQELPEESPLLPSPSKSDKKKTKEPAFQENVTQQDKDAKNLDKSQIARLQHKFMVLIMALLEMRDLKDSEIIMKRIIRALPKELLQHKITHIYLQHRSLYDKKYIIDAFGHVIRNDKKT